ncbi:hypothetical protein U6A24_07970 [Aquimarina gracilis]|uniref:Secreted protein n=1 Tax=Aquimarina gracilis TaxID=874422 RepID=A0ABU5ZTK7_9FLAO|nr:hypothetical protein [Aquimarina gracilis]MEB3345390.1 hypothetical protein [Aquimarina gracilis]
MKEIFQKISAILMSAIILLSTISFTVDAHYCGDDLVDLAFYKEAKSCGMEQIKSTKDCGDKVEKKSCCTDKQIVLEGQDDLKDNTIKLSFEQQVFIISYAYSYHNLFQNLDASITSFIGHPPPLLDKDYQVLYETFLI